MISRTFVSPVLSSCAASNAWLISSSVDSLRTSAACRFGHSGVWRVTGMTVAISDRAQASLVPEFHVSGQALAAIERGNSGRRRSESRRASFLSASMNHFVDDGPNRPIRFPALQHLICHLRRSAEQDCRLQIVRMNIYVDIV